MSESPKDLFANLDSDLDDTYEENMKICRIDGDSILLADGDNWYPIEFSRCDSHEKIVGWIQHLTDKKWITPKHLSLFLAHVFSHFPHLSPKDLYSFSTPHQPRIRHTVSFHWGEGKRPICLPDHRRSKKFLFLSNFLGFQLPF